MNNKNKHQWNVFDVKDNGNMRLLYSFNGRQDAVEYACRHASINGNLSLIRFNDNGVFVYWKDQTIREPGRYVFLDEETGEEIRKPNLNTHHE